MPVDPSAQDGATRVPVKGPDPPSEDPSSGPTQEPQVSTNSALSPYLDVEPLSVIMPETGPAYKNQKEDSEKILMTYQLSHTSLLQDIRGECTPT